MKITHNSIELIGNRKGTVEKQKYASVTIITLAPNSEKIKKTRCEKKLFKKNVHKCFETLLK